MSRKLASIQTILSLNPIPGADAILVAKVLGWECVVKVNEFAVGDKCVYFEIDSLLPVAKWNDHLRKGSCKPLRVKTVTLRGQLSQGLALPLSILPEGSYNVGDDVTELVGVEKWEPVVSPQLAGQVKGNFPSFLKKTDEIRLQAEPALLAEAVALGIPFKGRGKIDGTSFTAYNRYNENVEGYEKGVCSRNLDLTETEGNVYWNMANKKNSFGLNLFEILDTYATELRFDGKVIDNVAIQAELAGPGIQGNKMGYKGLKLIVFNLVVNGQYVGDAELERFCEAHNLEMAPLVFNGMIDPSWTVSDMLKRSNELLYDNGTPAEGIVYRPINETYSKVLKGRFSFKVISNVFLQRYKE